jgi:hypothetical protein
MTTFHTNGRIISISGQSTSPDPADNAPQSLNVPQVAYGSKILSPNSSSKVNEVTAVSVGANINIQSMAQPKSFTTTLKFKNPEHNNREIITANTLKGDQKQKNEDDLPCVGNNNNKEHPDDPCMICYYGRWTHKNNMSPTPDPCGAWVEDKKKCVYKKFPVPPCYRCINPYGLEYSCKTCEQCTDNGCKDICSPGFDCSYDVAATDYICKKSCNQERPCSSVSCYDCVDGYCKYRCGTGEDCLFGVCVNQGCTPECDPLKCERCEKISDTEFSCVPNYAPYQLCCNGIVKDKFANSCFEYNDNCEKINTCPPGETCLGTLCIKKCTVSAECTGPCEYCDDGFCSSLCGREQVCDNNVCKDLDTLLECEKCEQPVFSSDCNDSQLKSKECWSCEDSCANDSQSIGKPLKCMQDKQGNWFCSQYEIEQASLLDLLP